jgi:glycosyltransferase 2 family protein
VCTLFLRGWRWAVLIHPFAPQVSRWDTAQALAICYAANVAIPRAGEIMRAVSLKWTRKVSIGATLATVVVERILDTIWLILFLGISLLLLRDRLDRAFPGLGGLSFVVLLGCLLALAGLALISRYQARALSLIQPLLSRLCPGLSDKLTHGLTTFIHGLQALHTPSAYGKIVLSSILLNLAYTAIIYQAFAGFGFTQVYRLGPEAALVIMTLSSIGAIFPTPGAAGSYHAFFGKALIYFYAVDPNDALACATAVHAIATLTHLGLGIPALLIQRRRSCRQPTTANTEPGVEQRFSRTPFSS